MTLFPERVNHGQCLVWPFVNEKPSINWAHILCGRRRTTMLCISEAQVGFGYIWECRISCVCACRSKGRLILSMCYEFSLPAFLGRKRHCGLINPVCDPPQTPKFLLWKLKMAKAHVEAEGWHSHCTICLCAAISLFLFLPSRKSSHCWAIQLSGLNFLSTKASWSLAVV